MKKKTVGFLKMLSFQWTTKSLNRFQLSSLVYRWRKHLSGIREIAEALNISDVSIQPIVVDVLCMKRIAKRLIPKDVIVIFSQKERRVNIAKETLANLVDDFTIFKRIITGSEMWVYENDVETSQQSNKWRVKNWSNGNRFLRLSRYESLWIRSGGSIGQKGILLGCFESSREKYLQGIIRFKITSRKCIKNVC